MILSIIVMIVCQQSLADGFSYFEERIDYWSPRAENPSGGSAADNAENMISKNAAPFDGKESQPTFDWQKYMDPKRTDFFKEGDYVPPEPFMEVARDPSDFNVKMWFAYIDKKNALATRLQQRLGEYASKTGAAASIDQLKASSAPEPKFQAVEGDIKRYQFRMYFDSQCPHCQKMMGTMAELAERGFFVEAKQIDNLPYDSKNLPFVISKASRDEVARHHISSVPFVLVGDLKAKVVYKVSGYKSVDVLFQEIKGGENH
jgi:thiol-disulfide isomerase/thioredoxin